MSANKPDIDVIMLSNCADLSLYQMTCEAIETIKQQNYNCNFINIETNNKLHEQSWFDGTFTPVYPKEPFNYNRYLQIAESFLSDASYKLIINNDILMLPGCLSQLIKSGYDSSSPRCPNHKPHKAFKANSVGYRAAYQVAGWCILFKKEVADIGFKKLFPKQLKFWRQDQYYADIIKEHGFIHGLVYNALCLHLQSQSHHLLNDKQEFTHGQRKHYDALRRKG